MIEQEFKQLKETINNCEKCELSKNRIKPVFGNGNPFSEIFLIGEGPGREEDLKGEAFIGKSGQLLDKILLACGFSRDENVFIGNIVKCRPPGNRDPKPEEREACLPYLYRQLELIQPKIIILLGATALKGLIDPNAKITKVRGEWQHWKEYLIMPTFHPSALLRNPSLKALAWEDFKKVYFKYKELVDPYHFSDHIEKKETE